MKKQVYIAITAVVAAALLVITLNLLLGPNELKTWDFGEYADKKCPVVGYYPVTYRSYLPTEFEVSTVAEKLNHELKKKVGYGNFFVFSRKAFVTVRAAPQGYKGCEPLRAGAPEIVRHGMMAQTQLFTDKKTKQLTHAVIYFCLDKYKAAVKMLSKEGQAVRAYGGWRKFIKHELVHLIIGLNHPKWGAALMAESSRVDFLHERTLELIREVVSVCRKNKRLNQ